MPRLVRSVCPYDCPDACGLIATVEDGRLVRTWSGHSDALYAVALSPDQTLLATAGYDQKIKLWNVATGEMRFEKRLHEGPVWAVAFSADESQLAVTPGQAAVMYDGDEVLGGGWIEKDDQ